MKTTEISKDLIGRRCECIFTGMMVTGVIEDTEENEYSVNGKHSKKCTFYTLRFGCSFAAVNTIKPQLL